MRSSLGKAELLIIKNKALAESIIILLVCVFTYAVSVEYDVLEAIVAFSAKHENWDVDELLTVGIVLSFCLSVFSLRRWKELSVTHKTIQRISDVDSLTQLYNRRKMTALLQTEIERGKRYNRDFSVILLDIDQFKSVNDTWGHQVGDTLLCEFSKVLLSNIRSADFVGRWGGEEFLVICPETNQEEALILAEKLRAKIHQYDFTLVGFKTASFGVAGYVGGGEEAILHDADLGLYAAKDAGRNCIRTNHSQLTATPFHGDIELIET
ncbi:MAG: hypothetical protein AUK35_00135 [Zetaproteobacteria bacterium CG2_30_46_52]|nr:MAG: hypothetical protein AUK35_00135 [Zetaproteobacteria bacterium CG2_30_46_52]